MPGPQYNPPPYDPLTNSLVIDGISPSITSAVSVLFPHMLDITRLASDGSDAEGAETWAFAPQVPTDKGVACLVDDLGGVYEMAFDDGQGRFLYSHRVYLKQNPSFKAGDAVYWRDGGKNLLVQRITNPAHLQVYYMAECLAQDDPVVS